MNKGIRMATGDLIGIIHSDDALTDGALERLAAMWNGKTDVYYGDAIIMDEKGFDATTITDDDVNNYGI